MQSNKQTTVKAYISEPAVVSDNMPPSLTRCRKIKKTDRFTDDDSNSGGMPLMLITEWPVQEPLYAPHTVGSQQNSQQNAANAHINGSASV
jgi:hypothetical protein